MCNFPPHSEWKSRRERATSRVAVLGSIRHKRSKTDLYFCENITGRDFTLSASIIVVS